VLSNRNLRTFLRAASLAALLCAMTSFNAIAENAHVNEMVFDVQVPWKAEIHVTSSDGTKWDTILPGDMQLWAHMKVDTRHPGYVEQLGVFVGPCNNTECRNNPKLFEKTVLQRDYNHQSNLSFPTSKLGGWGDGTTTRYRDEILTVCNQHLQPDGATKQFSFSKNLTLSFSVNTRKAQFEGQMSPVEVGATFNGGDHTRQATFAIPVKCLAAPKQTVEKPDPKRYKNDVKKIDLALTALAAPPARHGAMQCKPVEVTTTIETEKAGPVNVKLWRRLGNGQIKHEVKTLDSKPLSGGKFGASWTTQTQFGVTMNVQYMAEVLGGTFAPSTPWKEITLPCTPADLTVSTGPTQSQQPKGRPNADFKTEPKIACAGGVVFNGACRCPAGKHPVQAGVNAWRCMPNAANLNKAQPLRSSAAVIPGNGRPLTRRVGQ
jgi:hypothetical protein